MNTASIRPKRAWTSASVSGAAGAPQPAAHPASARASIDHPSIEKRRIAGLLIDRIPT